MNLHKDKDLLNQLILLTAKNKNIDPNIVEKDYYVTLFLKDLVHKQPNIIFRGGTSLSKCHKIIFRFSEDIDLTYDVDGNFTESVKRGLKSAIIRTIDDLDLLLTNSEDIRSRRDFNRYEIAFPSQYDSITLKQYLLVETFVCIKSFPSMLMDAGCFITEYLNENNREDVIEQFDLYPYKVKTQNLDRTFIDKIFAICDYYLDKKLVPIQDTFMIFI